MSDPRYPGDLGKDDDRDGASFHHEPCDWVAIDYVNWKANRRWRLVKPQSIAWASSKWHPPLQWVLVALDLEDNTVKQFPFRSIQKWYPYLDFLTIYRGAFEGFKVNGSVIGGPK